VLILRSVAFNVLFYLNLVLYIIAAIPTFALPRRAFMTLAKAWGRTSNWLLRAVAGIRVEYRGLEKIPPGALIVASKHQSVWETFTLVTLFDDPTYIVKRELMWIPLFGWYLWKSNMIPVERTRGGAMAAMLERARSELARGRQIIIFAEGTRTAPGAPPAYRSGFANLYAATNVPCVPVALNSGQFWPRRKFLRYPGTIVLEVLDPIPPGLDKETFAARVQQEIEGAMARLIAEGERELSS
jgi:1-acyl-sn-glycerol-3-phosphate acyltransferase